MKTLSQSYFFRLFCCKIIRLFINICERRAGKTKLSEHLVFYSAALWNRLSVSHIAPLATLTEWNCVWSIGVIISFQISYYCDKMSEPIIRLLEMHRTGEMENRNLTRDEFLSLLGDCNLPFRWAHCQSTFHSLLANINWINNCSSKRLHNQSAG